MMEIEKKLAQTDLNVFKTAPAELLARQIVQYQNFSNKAAMSKINCMSYSPSAVRNYLTLGISYIKNGYKTRSVPTSIYNAIDMWQEKNLQPLTPAAGEERKFKKKKISEIVKPKVSVPDVPKVLTEKFEYGIKMGNTIKIYDSEEQCKVFIDALDFARVDTEHKLVMVMIDDISNSK